MNLQVENNNDTRLKAFHYGFLRKKTAKTFCPYNLINRTSLLCSCAISFYRLGKSGIKQLKFKKLIIFM